MTTETHYVPLTIHRIMLEHEWSLTGDATRDGAEYQIHHRPGLMSAWIGRDALAAMLFAEWRA